MSAKQPTISEVIRLLMNAERLSVYVGIPEAKTERSGGGLTNAQIAKDNTEGHDNVPSRPFLIPAIEKNKDLVEKGYTKAIKRLMAGDKPGYNQALEQLGQQMASRVRQYVRESKNFKPNAAFTIKMKGSNKPLIDTGAMVNSISYVIRKDA